ncbi:putative glutamate 5-kinase [Podosphaera aphanis]|nr:putative glutamate 5-kinase [Podosphaera aphanis]
MVKDRISLRIVIKLGTSSIVDEKTHEPQLAILSQIVQTVVKLRQNGHQVVIVSSGAVGVGLLRMSCEKRPKNLPTVQAFAAIGQCRLMTLWDQLFGHYNQPIAQVLLTRGDIAHRLQYLNAQNTFRELLEMGVIPIVNENDTIAVSEIKFGDNDTLSAITAAMVHAHYLFLLTDVDCLYDKNPRTHPEARAIQKIDDISDLQADVSSAGSSLGTGGMATKIVAARLATSAGIATIITRSSNPSNITKIVECIESVKSPPASPTQLDTVSSRFSSSCLNERVEKCSPLVDVHSGEAPPLHTHFIPSGRPMKDRQFWLLHGLAPHGTIFIDTGAHRAIKEKAGLLPVGVVDVEGNFGQLEAVRIVVVERISDDDTQATNTKPWIGPGIEIGRALVNYSATEVGRIKGARSNQIHGLLGYADSEYVVQRENVILFEGKSSQINEKKE